MAREWNELGRKANDDDEEREGIRWERKEGEREEKREKDGKESMRPPLPFAYRNGYRVFIPSFPFFPVVHPHSNHWIHTRLGSRYEHTLFAHIW